jgi:hypothetical protein
MMELTTEYLDAEWRISVTWPGRARVVRPWQQPERQSGTVFNCDGVSKITDDNSRHPLKTDSPRVETEEGTVNEVRL